MINPAWQENYRRGRYNRYPYDSIVSMIMRQFAHAEDRRGVRLLDLGCGGGNNLRFIQEQGFDFRAIDGAPESIRLTRDYLGLDPDDARIVEGDFRDLPFDDRMFDGVIDRASMGCNIFDDIRRIVGEIHRVLKPGGWYFGCDLCSLDHPDLRFANNIDGGDYDDFSDGAFVAARQVHGFSPDEIRTLFGAFDPITIKRIQTDDISGDATLPVTVSFDVSAQKKATDE